MEQELDKLRGEFRKKEADLILPLLSKYSYVEQKIEEYKNTISGRVKDLE